MFVHGCFWHGHDCSLFRLPGTRTQFWRGKIARNGVRDEEVRRALAEAGWRVLTVWECAFRGTGQIGLDETVVRTAAWLASQSHEGEIRGTRP